MVQAFIGDTEIGETTRSMERSKFALKAETQERLQELLQKRRKMFKELGKIKSAKRVTDLKPDVKPVCKSMRWRLPRK